MLRLPSGSCSTSYQSQPRVEALEHIEKPSALGFIEWLEQLPHALELPLRQFEVRVIDLSNSSGDTGKGLDFTPAAAGALRAKHEHRQLRGELPGVRLAPERDSHLHEHRL